MKRIVPLLSLFFAMILVGGMMSLALVSTAHACSTCSPTCQYGDCIPNPLGPMHAITMCRDGCCKDPTPYVTMDCYGHCAGGGACDCVKTGCWAGW